MTKEQKKEMEKLYNMYSHDFQYYIAHKNNAFAKKYLYKKSALESAVEILGYVFAWKGGEKKDGLIYSVYELITI